MIVLLVIVLPILTGLAIGFGWYEINKAIERNRKKKHPELFKLFEEISQKGFEVCNYYNEEVAPKKNQIDAIYKEWHYYTDGLTEQKKLELSELKEELREVNNNYEALNKELRELRTKAKTYVYHHNLKWAMKQGW